MRKHNWHPKIIEEYLIKYYKKPSREAARVYLKHFFTTMNEDPKTFIKKDKETVTKTLWEYAKKIEDRAPKTQSSMLSFIKKFLIRNKVEIDIVEFEDIRIRNNLKRTRAITKKKTPTPNDLKKILSYATGIKTRCLFVLCASTGLRIAEALSLTFNDIDMENRKIELIDEAAKGDLPRITFFTPEAKELLELWKPEREKMLNTRFKKSKYLRDKLEKQGYEIEHFKKCTGKMMDQKNYDFYTWKIKKDGRELSKEEILKLDNRVFPFDYVNANKIWVNLLEKAGKPFNEIDQNYKLKFKKYLYNIHSLRRFWFTQLQSDRANNEYVNYMGGHISELDSSYKAFESEVMRKRLQEEYNSHIGCLSIFEAVPDFSGIHNEMQEKDRKIKDMDETIEKMKTRMELLEMKIDVEKLKNGNDKRKKQQLLDDLDRL